MNTKEAIATRKSTRRFADKRVEEEKLAQILAAANQAPSGGNFRGCHLMVIRNRQVFRDLAEIATRTFAAMEYDENTYKSKKNAIVRAKRGLYEFHYNPDILIVVADQKSHPNALADSSCAMENMMLMANELDLGSVWINQLHWLDEDPEIRAYLAKYGLTEAETICASLAVGYADTADGLPDRTPLKKEPLKVTYID